MLYGGQNSNHSGWSAGGIETAREIALSRHLAVPGESQALPARKAGVKGSHFLPSENVLF